MVQRGRFLHIRERDEFSKITKKKEAKKQRNLNKSCELYKSISDIQKILKTWDSC